MVENPPYWTSEESSNWGTKNWTHASQVPGLTFCGEPSCMIQPPCPEEESCPASLRAYLETSTGQVLPLCPGFSTFFFPFTQGTDSTKRTQPVCVDEPALTTHVGVTDGTHSKEAEDPHGGSIPSYTHLAPTFTSPFIHYPRQKDPLLPDPRPASHHNEDKPVFKNFPS